MRISTDTCVSHALPVAAVDDFVNTGGTFHTCHSWGLIRFAHRSYPMPETFSDQITENSNQEIHGNPLNIRHFNNLMLQKSDNLHHTSGRLNILDPQHVSFKGALGVRVEAAARLPPWWIRWRLGTPRCRTVQRRLDSWWSWVHNYDDSYLIIKQ